MPKRRNFLKGSPVTLPEPAQVPNTPYYHRINQAHLAQRGYDPAIYPAIVDGKLTYEEIVDTGPGTPYVLVDLPDPDA